MRVYGADTGKPFVVCDRREDTCRVAIDIKALEQWQVSPESIGKFMAEVMGARFSGKRLGHAGKVEVGIVKGLERSQMLCLHCDSVGLVLIVGERSVPLVSVMDWSNGDFHFDGRYICRMIDAATGDPRYTPDTQDQETGKHNTQLMYVAWNEEYLRLKKENPKRTDEYCAKRIAEMPIGQGRDSETIRKNMKHRK